jgi:hypothetical protein
MMITMEMIKNHDFGTVHLQRFDDVDFIRVYVMKSTACKVPLLTEDGVAVLDPSMDVLTDDEIPNAIGELWLELQRRLHYGRTGRRNEYGLFFHDPLPFALTCPF